jgi:uncharacterized paraquat-inducible protein A
MAKMDLAFDVESGHVAMTFAGFECLESLKCLFPPPITLTPYKSNLIELCLTPAIEVVLFVTLNGDPLAEPIAVLLVKTGERRNAPHARETQEGAATPLFQAFSASSCLRCAIITTRSHNFTLAATQAVLSPIAWAVFIDPDQIVI